MGTHTPGPWWFAADARLISAAPDLLQALYDCRALIEDPDADGFAAVKLAARITALIKQVEGEP
jgi:hypothetical protein